MNRVSMTAIRVLRTTHEHHADRLEVHPDDLAQALTQLGYPDEALPGRQEGMQVWVYDGAKIVVSTEAQRGWLTPVCACGHRGRP